VIQKRLVILLVFLWIVRMKSVHHIGGNNVRFWNSFFVGDWVSTRSRYAAEHVLHQARACSLGRARSDLFVVEKSHYATKLVIVECLVGISEACEGRVAAAKIIQSWRENVFVENTADSALLVICETELNIKNVFSFNLEFVFQKFDKQGVMFAYIKMSDRRLIKYLHFNCI